MKRVTDIVRLVGPKNCRLIGRIDREFRGVQSIDRASSRDLTFCAKKGEEAIRLLMETGAGVVICDTDLLSRNISFGDKTLVLVNRPRLWFIRCMESFFKPAPKTGIHRTALAGQNASLGDDIYIGPYTTIGDNVLIGSGTRIYSGVHIHDSVRIGRNVIVKSGAVIGSDGFGFERNDEGALERFPHIGGVIIEDDVQIGANTCIDRGTISDTLVGTGTKIDNLVHVAHNVVIGKYCVIVALAMIGGGVRIGDGSWIAPTACIRDGVVIGKGSLVGMGAVVTKNVRDGDVVIGVPARSMKRGKR